MASTSELAEEYYNTAREALSINDIEEAIDNLNMAQTLYEELDDKLMNVRILNMLTIAYGLAGKNSMMAKTILDALAYCDSNNIVGAKHLFYSAICDRYIALHDYDNAINYGLMAIQDLEENSVHTFGDVPGWFLVSYLNAAYAFLEAHVFDEAAKYLGKAKRIAKENNIDNHNYTFDVMEAKLKYCIGDKEYAMSQIDNLTNIAKSDENTLMDFIQDIEIFVSLLLDLKEYDKAEDVVRSLAHHVSSETEELKTKLEASKLLMKIFKASGNKEKYNEACVTYAESDIEFHHTTSEKQLAEMDTTIALSIANVNFDI